MNMLELIEKRVSVRSYRSDKAVPKDILTEILEAGRLAPSAANRQAWHFYLISSPEKLDAIKACYPAPWFKDAPHVLVVVGNRDEAWQRKTDAYNAIETDLTIAMDHMILTAASLEVGTCWIAAFDPAVLAQAIELKESELVFAITPLGYPEDDFIPRQKTRKEAKEVYSFI